MCISGLIAHAYGFPRGLATRVAFSDASSTGYRGCVVELWSEITELAGHAVKWFTNNQNVVCIMQAGSRPPTPSPRWDNE